MDEQSSKSFIMMSLLFVPALCKSLPNIPTSVQEAVMENEKLTDVQYHRYLVKYTIESNTSPKAAIVELAKLNHRIDRSTVGTNCMYLGVN